MIIQLHLAQSNGGACSHLPSKDDTDITSDTVCLAFSCFLFLFATCMVRNTKNGRCDSILLGDSFLKTFKKD